MTTARGGRPRKDPQHKRSERAVTNLSPAEYRRVASKAAGADLTISEYLRAAVLDKRLVNRSQSTPDFATRQALQRIGNNLNQMAKRLNTHPSMTAPPELTGALRNLETILARWLTNDSAGG